MASRRHRESPAKVALTASVRPPLPRVLGSSPGEVAFSRTDRTLSELAPVFLGWFRLVRQRSENTLRGYQTNLKAFLEFAPGAGLVYPDDVRVQHIEFFMGGVLHEQRNLQPASVNRHLHALRSFWRWMEREEITTRNPAARAFLLKQPKRLPKCLSVPQQEQLLSALAQDESPAGLRDYALLATLNLTGLRRSELSNLQLTDVNLDTGEMRVIGKGDKERPVWIAPMLGDILRRYLTDARPQLLRGRSSRYVFVRVGTWGHAKEGQPLGPMGVYRIVRDTLKRVLGIEKGHPHALRHSFASRVRENGGTLQDLQEWMGHASISTTARYAHLMSASQRERMSALITGVPVQRTPNGRTKT